MKNIQISMFPLTHKVKKSVERLQAVYDGTPLWISTSKGKDSLVLEGIAELSGCKYEKHFTLTSVDPPELIEFAKRDKDLIIDVPRYPDGTQITMWNLIVKKKFPPTRRVRYCCSELKECFGVGEKVCTGVRWAESVNRQTNQGEVTFFDKKMLKNINESKANYRVTKRGGIVMNLDNDENRRMIEQCYRTSKMLINPIIDWTDNDVWEFIKGEKIEYPDLYDKGYNRIGCIGCPMSGKNGDELEKYPIYKQNYINAFDRMIHKNKDTTNYKSWRSGQDVYDWWISGGIVKDKIIDGQTTYF